MGDEDLICFCMAVGKTAIEEEVRKGTHETNSLKVQLGCCMGCGTCEGRLVSFVEEVRARMAAEASGNSENSEPKPEAAEESSQEHGSTKEEQKKPA